MARTLAILMAMLGSAAWAQVNIERSPVTMGTGIEMGQVVNGYVKEASTPIDGLFHQRIGIYVNQQAIVNQKLQIDIGVGGLFWYAYPIQAGAPWAASTKFGPGISSAAATYYFGKPGESNLNLKFGFFTLKYNQDAKNLGEYLFRSPAYPGFVQTGHWWTVNSAFTWVQGAHLHWNTLGGFLKNDFFLLMERDYPPMGDMSPTYMFTVNQGGAWEVGGGVSFHHLIPVRPSKVAPNDFRNKYYNVPDQFLYRAPDDGNPLTVEDTSYVLATPTETRMGDTLKTYKGPGIGITTIGNTDLSSAVDNKGNPRQVKYNVEETYTLQGVKLMARGALDLQKLLGLNSNLFSPSDLRLFGEIAVLGVKNYKYYYDDITARMPMMMGINLPTMRFLDVLSVQGEYYKAKFPHDFDYFYNFNIAVPTLDDPDPAKQVDRKGGFWKWSVYGSKTLMPGMSLFGQVAHDHYRTLDFNGKAAYRGVLPAASDWYYLLRVEFSI